MLPKDPEREIVGRSIAALLMAQQIRQHARIHAETVLTEIGALAGFAAQMSIRKAVIEAQQLDLESVLIEVTTKSDEKYYFSDLLNWILFENTREPPYSIWAYVSEVVPNDQRMLLPDIGEIVSHAARTVGAKNYGVPRLPPGHMPHIMPRAALEMRWRLVVQELVASGRDPSNWPYDLALAAQWQMSMSRDMLALPLAATVVMEAAVPMSKIDPRTVPGA